MDSLSGFRDRPVSWVRRGVRMTDGQATAWQQHGHKYLIEPPRTASRESVAPGWVLDPTQVFEVSQPGSDSRFIIEIGTGRGENIVSAAAREPETNFLGVEVYGPGLARAILLAESAGTGVPIPHLGPGIGEAIANCPTTTGGLANLRLIQADAPELLEALPEASVDEFWVFFPDPWPKTRHFKRRMIDPGFAKQVAKVLKPNGVIRLATDWQHYAHQMQEVFTASSEFEPVQTSDGQTERFTGRVLTAFESKGIREGREITDLVFRKREGEKECMG